MTKGPTPDVLSVGLVCLGACWFLRVHRQLDERVCSGVAAEPRHTGECLKANLVRIGVPFIEPHHLDFPNRAEGVGVSQAAQLPAAVHAHAAFATCDVTYSLLKNHLLSAERRFTVLESKVPIKDFQKYQTWYDDCGASGVPFIQLHPSPKVTTTATVPEPKAPAAPPGLAAGTKPSDSKAADLIRQAQQSLRSLDLDGARKLLDQAEAINSTEPYLWSGYAAIAEQLGTNIQALEDMQRELTYHPEEVQFYPYVSSVELGTGDMKAALATFRSWVKAAPDSVPAAIALARQLVVEKSPAEALEEASSAIDRLKPTGNDLTELSIAAAKAQVYLGQTSVAANSVAPLLKTVTNPDQPTAIASILAEGSAYLSEAAAAEGKALEASETETGTWTATSNFGSLMQQEKRIAAEWDPMGLILLHEGKFTQALATPTPPSMRLAARRSATTSRRSIRWCTIRRSQPAFASTTRRFAPTRSVLLMDNRASPPSPCCSATAKSSTVCLKADPVSTRVSQTRRNF
jgi:tetratricopeptide (TPR) repeat protein